jgi:hypothetical protein
VNPVFAINFRREAYRLERARTRRRAVAVGTWVAYLGVVALTLGLYAMNLGSLLHRTRLLETQTRRLRAAGGTVQAWKPGEAELRLAEKALANPQRWHTRLARLATVLPANARITRLDVNPDNLPGAADQERLVIVGELRPLPGQDGMRGIMALVQALHSDARFAAQYRTIRLVESRVGDGSAPTAFRIECR